LYQFKNFKINSIDTKGKTIKDSLDMMVKLLGCSYEVLPNKILVYQSSNVFLPNVNNVKIEESRDDILNDIKLWTEEQGSGDKRLIGNFSDDNSIFLYGKKSEEITIPFYIDSNFEIMAKNLLITEPMNNGSFSLFSNQKLRFDSFFVPYYEKNIVISSCQSLENWTGLQGDYSLVDGILTKRMIKIENNPVSYNYDGGVNLLRLDFIGNAKVEIILQDDSVFLYK
jgi:hypothetical protein